MADKKDSIFASALELFVSKGFHGTSTAAVAKNADVSNGTLFHYFATKDVLVRALHEQVKAEQLQYIEVGLEEISDTRIAFEEIWKRAIQWAVKNKEKYHFLHQYKYSPYKKGGTQKELKKFKTVFEELVEKGIQQKKMKFMPWDFAFESLNAHIYGMVQYVDHNPVKYRTPEFMRQSFEWFWTSMKP